MGNLITIIVAIFPRREAFESGSFYGWRIYIAAAALVSIGAITMNYALAFGFVTLFGFSGFAQAGEVADLANQQKQFAQELSQNSNSIMSVVIGGHIFSVRTQQCAASKAGNDAAVTSLSRELQGNLDSYQKYAGRPYNLLPCP